MPYEFFPQRVRSQLPALYSQEHVKDPLCLVKFFTPDSNYTFYATEFDGEDTFFGLIVGFEVELGYFSLSEITASRGPFGLAVERDIHFTPTLLSIVRGWHPLAHGDGSSA